ncbi:MAG TPA: polysaccharide biosynthesis C-terminal domain-containing protein, partial [Lachnospiraceae bacterium]|nr:polysaccharide biosynthesis C-terminal domain-containing protein [Lachnospiraceae bacterium]
GIFNTQYNQMINLPAAIATAMASASIPSIVASFTRKEMEGVKQKIDVVLKINMLIAIPSAIGLAVLADPIMSVLFPGLEAYHSTAVRLLQTGSSAVIFYTLSTMTTSVLQGCDRMRIPVIHSGISLAIHVAVVAVLVYYTDLSVYALIIGNVTFPLIVCLLNCRSVSKLLGYRFDWNNILMKPMLAALIMGAAAYGTYILVLILVKSKLIAMIGSILVALVIYLVLLYLWKVLTKEVLSRLPLVGKRFR